MYPPHISAILCEGASTSPQADAVPQVCIGVSEGCCKRQFEREESGFPGTIRIGVHLLDVFEVCAIRIGVHLLDLFEVCAKRIGVHLSDLFEVCAIRVRVHPSDVDAVCAISDYERV